MGSHYHTPKGFESNSLRHVYQLTNYYYYYHFEIEGRYGPQIRPHMRVKPVLIVEVGPHPSGPP
jgi:hypothetical protein